MISLTRFFSSNVLGAHANSTYRALIRFQCYLGIAVVLKACDLFDYLMALNGESVLLVPYEFSPPLPGAELSTALCIIMAISGGLLVVNFLSRVALSVVCCCIAFLLACDQQLYSNHFYLMGLLVLLLLWARLGESEESDSASNPTSAIPAFLIRLQISLVYFFGGITKLNTAFVSGLLISANLRNEGLFSVPQYLRIYEVMSPLAVATIVIEILLAVGLWTRLRFLIIPIGVGLHVSIPFLMSEFDYTTMQLCIFSIMMLGSYWLFIAENRSPVPGTDVLMNR